MYSSLNPCEVRSPEITTMSGSISFTSAIARSRCCGRKNCCPQCRSESWTILNIAGRLIAREAAPRSLGARKRFAIERHASGRRAQLFARQLEDPVHRVVQAGRNKPRGGDREKPCEDD